MRCVPAGATWSRPAACAGSPDVAGPGPLGGTLLGLAFSDRAGAFGLPAARECPETPMRRLQQATARTPTGPPGGNCTASGGLRGGGRRRLTLVARPDLHCCQSLRNPLPSSARACARAVWPAPPQAELGRTVIQVERPTGHANRADFPVRSLWAKTQDRKAAGRRAEAVRQSRLFANCLAMDAPGHWVDEVEKGVCVH